MKRVSHLLLSAISLLLFVLLFGGMLVAFFALLWEAWTSTPEDRAAMERQWEQRDEIPEELKAEMRARYHLLAPDEQEAAAHHYLTNNPPKEESPCP